MLRQPQAYPLGKEDGDDEVLPSMLWMRQMQEMNNRSCSMTTVEYRRGRKRRESGWLRWILYLPSLLLFPTSSTVEGEWLDWRCGNDWYFWEIMVSWCPLDMLTYTAFIPSWYFFYSNIHLESDDVMAFLYDGTCSCLNVTPLTKLLAHHRLSLRNICTNTQLLRRDSA